jgi:predicted aspartyl protease
MTAAAISPPTLEQADERAPSAYTERRARLLFELNGKRFPLPLVTGSIGGQRTLMLVDTGANSHVIAGWLARKANLPLRKLGDLGTDHAGRAIATSRAESPKIILDSWGAVADGPALVADVPEMIEKLGIGAFISPQKLAEAGNVVVLDLARGELHASSLAAATFEIATRGKPIATNGVLPCVDDASTIKGLAYVLPALIEGSHALLLLDTGAQKTDVLASNHVGRGLIPRSIANKDAMYAASGKLVTRTVKGATVRIGEFSTTADVDIVPGTPDPVCPRDGVVSMDVLRHCILVLGAKDIMGRCE